MAGTGEEMITKRVFLAGLLGGVAMYIWTSLAHMVLPLGEVGIKEIANEEPVLNAMHSAIGDVGGFYFFPGTGLADNASMQQKQAAMPEYEKKLRVSPSGILIYHPPGARSLTPQQLIGEFVIELIESLLAAMLLAQTSLAGFGSRVGFVVLTGILAAIATNVSYWIWYSFPASYTAAYMTTEIVGFLCAGLVIAAVMKKRQTGLRMAKAA